ncbi:GGDEF domain-containing protein [Butyrivibrio sp. AE3004]|uniref:GGDEF domain-containing protein n=1 Tax=Butyrivibrio sp. AE3004 TaxID=1506994 RepID=UPI000494460A|nr:GGDEF domain-containing protein [Butyrivibrio sp. AE3004]
MQDFIGKQIINRRYLKLPFLIIFLSAVLFAMGSRLFTTPLSTSFTQLDSGWSVCRGEKVYNDVTLSDFSIDDSKKGEVITIKGHTPAVSILSPTIMFKSSLLAVDVWIDGKKEYSFGHETAKKGLIVPKQYNMVTLPDSDIEHDVQISFTIYGDKDFSRFSPIYYGDKHEFIRNFLQYHRLDVFIGGFFFMYSCLFISLGVFLALNRRSTASVFITAAVSMLLGIYTYSYGDIFCFISDNALLFSLLEYVSLYLIPLSISVLLYSIHPEIANVSQRLILAVNTVLPMLFIILHLTDTVHIQWFVVHIQVMGILEALVMLPALVLGIRSERKHRLEAETYIGSDADNYLILGFILLIIFAILEVIRYNFNRYNTHLRAESIFANISYLVMGLLFFIICLFIYYFLNGIEHLNANNVKKQLEGLAYIDALTGLMNRAKCMQYAASLDNQYAVVNLDMDRLKTVNDNLGHLEGDRMLKAFADIMRMAFAEADFIGRTGGDEFMVIFENPESDVCDRCIRMMEKYMDEFNKKNDTFTLSASAGYAYSYEAGGKYEDVFYLADTRMYRMKEQHHNA